MKRFSQLSPYLLIFLIIVTLGNLLVFLKLNLKKLAPKSVCPNCNVVIIDVDVLRSDALKCNDEIPNAPNLCNLTKKAFNFTDNFSHSILTIPSFISGLTSLYPSSHQVWNEFNRQLDSRIQTLPQILASNGYETYIYGDVQSRQLITSVFSHSIESGDIFNNGLKPESLLQELAKSPKPFLLYLHTADLHFPYMLPDYVESKNPYPAPKNLPITPNEIVAVRAEYIAKHVKKVFKPEAIKAHPELFTGNLINKKMQIDDFFQTIKSSPDTEDQYIYSSWLPVLNSYIQFLNINNPEHISYIKYNYLTVLKTYDSWLKNFTKLLTDSSLDKNTIVIIKTDHGEEFMEHGSIGHQNFAYQELIHTPLIIKIPNLNGINVNQGTQDIDIAPTVLDLLGLNIPSQFQGQSLIPAIKNPGFKLNEIQIAQNNNGTNKVIKKDNYKLIISNNTPIQLYDLNTDPAEQRNLINDQPLLSRQLLNSYQNIISNSPVYMATESAIHKNLDEETRKRLIKEGYF
jgi:membrane-anchored protein YejM (alkaline phosphatase superfamily)